MKSSDKDIRIFLDTIVHRVEEARLVKDWKHRELAQRAGVRTMAADKNKALSSWWPQLRLRIYNGTVPNFRNIVRIAHAFGIDAGQLLQPYADMPQADDNIVAFPMRRSAPPPRKQAKGV